MTAAGVLGIGRTVAYELVRTGRLPTPVLRLGKQFRVPTAYLIELIGLSPDAAPPLPRPAADG
jgi:excisionase family DNA binding protein